MKGPTRKRLTPDDTKHHPTSVRPGKKRLDKIAAIRKRMANAEHDELERVKKKLRHHEPLKQFEEQMILRSLEGNTAHDNVGAPALLTSVHRWIAIDIWWQRETGKGRHGPKKVATRWGISVKAVLKYANEHKQAALHYVHERQAKAKVNSELYPDSAIEETLNIIADGFRRLDE